MHVTSKHFIYHSVLIQYYLTLYHTNRSYIYIYDYISTYICIFVLSQPPPYSTRSQYPTSYNSPFLPDEEEGGFLLDSSSICIYLCTPETLLSSTAAAIARTSELTNTGRSTKGKPIAEPI